MGQQVPARANQLLPSSTADSKVDTYAITFDSVPLGGESYLFAPGAEAARFSVSTTYTTRGAANVPTIWQANNPLQAGDQYTAEGYVSTATDDELSQVSYPNVATPGSSVYPPGVLQLYLPSNEPIDPYIKQIAEQATKGTTSMYDAAQHLENYLRAGFTYSTTNADPPSNEDAVVWFLKNKKGFCTFFASAMALMGRSLGMPTRVALGFTGGTYDQDHGNYVVRGTQAHMWTQVYFGKYGWINFEPTASFNKFFRPITLAPGATPSVSGTGTVADARRRQRSEVQSDRPKHQRRWPELAAEFGGRAGWSGREFVHSARAVGNRRIPVLVAHEVPWISASGRRSSAGRPSGRLGWRSTACPRRHRTNMLRS